MALFDYRAISRQGRRVRGRLDALNLADLEMRLQRMELDLIRAKTAASRRPGAHRAGRRELINFCFHLEQLLRAGVPLQDGLADLRDSLEAPRLREVAAGLMEGIAGGQTLSQAMAAYPGVFGGVFVSLIRAGEASGQLPEVLAKLIESTKWEDELAAHAKKLLLYPAFVAVVVLAATCFLMLYLVPQLKQFVSHMGQTLPPHTRLLFFLANLLRVYWPFFLALPLAAFFLLNLLLRHNPLARLRFDAFKLRLPVLGGIVKKIILARFATAFAMLYAAGIPILDAMGATRDIAQNRAVEAALEQAEQGIRDGRNVAGAFQDTGLFPPLVVRMLRVGEATGSLDHALRNVGYFYNRDAREAVERFQAMIEPLLTVVLGLLLGWIMLAVIGPIYDVISRVKT